MKVFADRLKKMREIKKESNPQYTQGYIAEILGVARTTYTAYENGTKQPPMETIIKIAKLFNTSTDYLYGLSDTNSMGNDRLSEEDRKMLEFFKNPELNLFFKEIAQSEEGKLEQLRKIWEAIKDDIK